MQHSCNPNILVLISDLFLPRQVSSVHIVDFTDNHPVERLGPDDDAQVPKVQSGHYHIRTRFDLD